MGFLAWLILAGAVLFIYSAQKGTSPLETIRAVLSGKPMPGPKYEIESGKKELFPGGGNPLIPSEPPAKDGFGKKYEGYLIRPVPGVVTSPYGMRWGRMHHGIDIGAPHGTPIKAAASGTVGQAGWWGAGGNAVRIDHTSQLSTRYAHLSRYAVKAGQQVTQGQVIGYVGSTGNATGPHLHFEVRVKGASVDPLKFGLRGS